MRWLPWKSAAEKRDEIIAVLRAEDKEKVEREEAEKKAEDTPWVDIKGILEDPKHGIKIDLDWNNAFIEYLRENGMTGADDETVVQKWITLLYRDLIEQDQAAQEQGVNNGLV